MDVAFISEFTSTERVFRYVDAEAVRCPVEVGGADSLEDSYCQSVVDGRLPEWINDASALPAAAELPVTAALPVGAHLSVPIRLADGRVFGTFCCFSAEPDYSLNDRDLARRRVFADLTGAQIDRDLVRTQRQEDMLARLRRAMAGDGLSMVFQPIADTEKGNHSGSRLWPDSTKRRFAAPTCGSQKRLRLAYSSTLNWHLSVWRCTT